MYVHIFSLKVKKIERCLDCSKRVYVHLCMYKRYYLVFLENERSNMQNQKKSIRKNLRISKNTDSKIQELVKRKKVESFGLEKEISETNIFEEAIDFFHSHKFGDKVKDSILEILENDIHNAVENSFQNFATEFLSMYTFLQQEQMKNRIYLEMVLKILEQQFDLEYSNATIRTMLENKMELENEIEEKIKKEFPLQFQYLKLFESMKDKIKKSEIHDETNLPF